MAERDKSTETEEQLRNLGDVKQKVESSRKSGRGFEGDVEEARNESFESSTREASGLSSGYDDGF